MILVHQRYSALPGMGVAVLATRRKADARLRELGVPVGRTFTRDQPDDAPDVIWECTYETIDERQRVEAILDADPAFTAIRAEQRDQLRHFAREYYTLDAEAGENRFHFDR